MYSLAKFTALFGFVACFILHANAHANNVGIEEKYSAKFGSGKVVRWDLASKMTPQQLAQLCSDIHALTGNGPAQMKDARVVNAYLRYEDGKLKPNATKVLRCEQNNKRRHTYYATQGVDKNGLTLVESEGKKAKGMEVFHFTWSINQVRGIPALLKLEA